MVLSCSRQNYAKSDCHFKVSAEASWNKDPKRRILLAWSQLQEPFDVIITGVIGNNEEKREQGMKEVELEPAR